MNETQLAPGELLKENGVDRVAANHLPWMEQARERLMVLALAGDPFTADDLRLLGPPPNPNCTGAAFRHASRDGLIRHCGYRKAKAPTAHARVVGIWKGCG